MQPKTFLVAYAITTALFHGIVDILFANSRKSLKFYCFESVQNIILEGLEIHSFFFLIFCTAEADIVFNFEQKCASYVLIRKSAAQIVFVSSRIRNYTDNATKKVPVHIVCYLAPILDLAL